VDDKLLKKCSVSLTRLDVSLPPYTSLERSKSFPSALSIAQPSTSTGKWRIPKKKAPDAILEPYQRSLHSIFDKLRAIRQAAEKDKENIAGTKRRPVKKKRSEKCEERKEKEKSGNGTKREKKKRERKKARMIEFLGEETEEQDSDSVWVSKKKLVRKEDEKSRKEKTEIGKKETAMKKKRIEMKEMKEVLEKRKKRLGKRKKN